MPPKYQDIVDQLRSQTAASDEQFHGLQTSISKLKDNLHQFQENVDNKLQQFIDTCVSSFNNTQEQVGELGKAINELKDRLYAHESTPASTTTTSTKPSATIPLPTTTTDGNIASIKISYIESFIRDYQTTGEESSDDLVKKLKLNMETIVRWAARAVADQIYKDTGKKELPTWGKLDDRYRRLVRELAVIDVVTSGVPVDRTVADWVLQYVISNHWHSKVGHYKRELQKASANQSTRSSQQSQETRLASQEHTPTAVDIPPKKSHRFQEDHADTTRRPKRTKRHNSHRSHRHHGDIQDERALQEVWHDHNPLLLCKSLVYELSLF